MHVEREDLRASSRDRVVHQVGPLPDLLPHGQRVLPRELRHQLHQGRNARLDLPPELGSRRPRPASTTRLAGCARRCQDTARPPPFGSSIHAGSTGAVGPRPQGPRPSIASRMASVCRLAAEGTLPRSMADTAAIMASIRCRRPSPPRRRGGGGRRPPWGRAGSRAPSTPVVATSAAAEAAVPTRSEAVARTTTRARRRRGMILAAGIGESSGRVRRAPPRTRAGPAFPEAPQGPVRRSRVKAAGLPGQKGLDPAGGDSRRPFLVGLSGRSLG